MSTRIINVSTTSTSDRLLKVPEIPTTLKDVISDYHFYRNKLIIGDVGPYQNVVTNVNDSCLGSENDLSVPDNAIPPGVDTNASLSKNFVKFGSDSGSFSGLHNPLNFFKIDHKEITLITSFHFDGVKNQSQNLFGIIGDQPLVLYVERNNQTGMQVVVGNTVYNPTMANDLSAGFHTIAIKVSKNTLSVFLDKLLLGTTSLSGGYNLSRGSDLNVGSSVTGSVGYFGFICSLQILSYLPSDTDIIEEMTRLESEMLI